MEVWLDGRRAIWSRVEVDLCDGVLIGDDDDDDDESLFPKTLTWCRDATQASLLRRGSETCAVVRTQDEAYAAMGSASWIYLEAPKASMITLENVIAASSATGTKIACLAHTVADITGAAFALESGVDAIVLADADLWDAAAARATARRRQTPSKKKRKKAPKRRVPTLAEDGAVVTKIVSGVVADRVAIDLVQLLKPGEGALVGSASSALALVHGETLPSALVAPRPFRVNAGPCHSYVLLADGSTKYLCELEPCDLVAVVDVNANEARPVAVGRLKVETRPHLCIHFRRQKSQTGETDDDDRESLSRESGDDDDDGDDAAHTVFLQQAETVRVVVLLEDGISVIPKSVTDLEVGDVIAASFDDGFGTHCGTSIGARVIER